MAMDLVNFGANRGWFTIKFRGRRTIHLDLEDAHGVHDAMGKAIEMYEDSLVHPERYQ